MGESMTYSSGYESISGEEPPTRSIRQRLRRMLCPHRIDEVETEEEAKAKYDDYQQFLSVIMTVATLLMGFILTGSLLNYNYIGQVRRRDFATPFNYISCSAVALAALSVILALLVSIRGSVVYRNRGAIHALRSMRHSTCSIGVAELSTYFSINFFFLSVLMYISWSQRGPTEICSSTRGPWADCPDLTEQFDDAAHRLCSVPPESPPPDACDEACKALAQVCQYHRINGTIQEETLRLWFMDNDSVALQKVGLLASEHCRADRMSDLAESLCSSSLSSQEAKVSCMQANSASLKAEDCVDESVHLAALCSNVCFHETSLRSMLWHWGVVGTVLLMLLVLVRTVKISQQCASAFLHHSNNSAVGQLMVRELGCLDNFDTDSDE